MKLRKVKTIAYILIGVFCVLLFAMAITRVAAFGYITSAGIIATAFFEWRFWRCPYCDKFLGRLDEDEKKAYGDTLLNSLKTTGHYNDRFAAVTLTEGAEQLKERLDAIMNFRKKSKTATAVTLALTIVLCIGSTAVGAYAAPTDIHKDNGEAGQVYTYSQQGYYQGEYFFELGWNLNGKGYDAYSDKVELKLSDRTAITVSFDKACKGEAQNNAVLADLTELVERLKHQYSSSATPLEKPLVVSIEYVGDRELVKLAEEYYTNDRLTRFSAIFSSLDKDLQNKYITKMIDDKRLTFLSSTAKDMEADMLDFCLEKTYLDGKLTLFSCIVPYLTIEQRQAWVTRASRDNKNTFLAVLTQSEPELQNIQGAGSSKEKTNRQDSLVNSFAQFSVYGLVYIPEQDRAFFNGQEVKAFVDIREMFPGGAYSFNLGYIESDSSSTLYLMAVRDKNGLVTGVQEMSSDLQNELYGIDDSASPPEPYNPDLTAEINNNRSEILKEENVSSAYDEGYVVFDATATLNDWSITATDKLNSTDIPKTISDWILTCQGSKEVNVKRITENGKVTAWIYYDSDTRMAWKMNTDGTTLRFVLTDSVPQAISGATLIRYQAPEKYQAVEVLYKGEALKINVQ